MSGAMSIGPGDVLDGKYQIVRLIGEGGMGAVFEGMNTFIRRRVAIKVLLAAAKEAGNGVLERFEREAQAAGCIGSDHILEVLDLGSLPNGDRYMVMEFLDGESLADRIKRMGRMAPHEVAPLIRQALIGLDAAHAAGIVHRDLKPDNIYVIKEKAGRSDFVKIIDFGISKFNALSGDMSMTRTGAVMGTPYYMSPEQAKGAGGVNHLSDLYSMGVIAFESLTGRVPFEGTTFNDLMFKIVLSDMPSLEEAVPGIDPGFAAIVKRAMARDGSYRYQTAKEFIAAIDEWQPQAKTAVNGTPARVSEAMAPTQRAPNELAPAAASAATNLDWAASQADVAGLPPKKPAFVLYGAVAAGLLAVAGIGFALSGSNEEAQAGAAQPDVIANTAPGQPPEAKPPEAKPPEAKPIEPVEASKPATSTTPVTTPVTTSKPVVAASKPATSTPKPATSTPKPTTPATTKPKPKPGTDFGY